ncbi:MAG: hypothetical protein FWD67_12555 [Betaproteobacteria bacterium]|nr:hypothetical protein [Betaproteobacteria bacterium]
MQKEKDPKLVIEKLHERHIGLTAALAEMYTESASVCLSRHHHSPVRIGVSQGVTQSAYSLDFPIPDTRTLNAYANTLDTTENGAYGVCLAAVEAEENLFAIKRAETLTGADWYVAPKGAPIEDMENCYRLEVSGLDAGSPVAVRARLRQKIDQTRRGASNLPAIASVVGFKELAIAIEKVEVTS